MIESKLSGFHYSGIRSYQTLTMT